MARIVSLFIASPGDVDTERNHVAGIAGALNRIIAAERDVRFEVLGWKTHVRPRVNDQGPQGPIDEDLPVEQCDIVVGMTTPVSVGERSSPARGTCLPAPPGLSFQPFGWGRRFRLPSGTGWLPSVLTTAVTGSFPGGILQASGPGLVKPRIRAFPEWRVNRPESAQTFTSFAAQIGAGPFQFRS